MTQHSERRRPQKNEHEMGPLFIFPEKYMVLPLYNYQRVHFFYKKILRAEPPWDTTPRSS